MQSLDSNIKYLVDMCKATVETVGDVTLCKELPESTLEVVNEMIREVFHQSEVFSNLVSSDTSTQSFKLIPVKLSKEDLFRGGWWCKPSKENMQAMLQEGLTPFLNIDTFDSNDYASLECYTGCFSAYKSRNTKLKEIELINGSFYYV